MAEGQGDRVEALFEQAVDLPPQEQRALLDAACATDPALRALVERLLADDARLRAREATFLDSPLMRLPAADHTRASAADSSGIVLQPAFPLPERVGRYRVLRLLGEALEQRRRDEARPDHLQGDTAVRAVLLRLVDGAHAALAEQAQVAVTANPRRHRRRCDRNGVAGR